MKGVEVGVAGLDPAVLSILANGFPASCSKSSLALSDPEVVFTGGAVTVASHDGLEVEADTPNRSRMFGVSSVVAAGAAANGLLAEAFSLN